MEDGGAVWDIEVGVTCVLTTDQHGSRPWSPVPRAPRAPHFSHGVRAPCSVGGCSLGVWLSGSSLERPGLEGGHREMGRLPADGVP